MTKFLPISKPSITQKEIDNEVDAVSSRWVSSLGEYINIFEEKFALFCDCKYALTTSNGTAALHLSLVSLVIGQNDEVVIPDFTFASLEKIEIYS